MRLTPYTLEKIGFEKLPEGELVEATFYSIHIFNIWGITFEDGKIVDFTWDEDGGAIKLAFGNDLNEMCRKLNGDVLIDDLEQWKKERECTRSFMVVLLGPTKEHSVKGCYLQKSESFTTTYDCFETARDELQLLASKALPKLLTALACQLSSSLKTVSFNQVEHTFFGETAEGRRIFDLQFKANVRVGVSTQLDENGLVAAVEQASQLEKELDPKITKFFHLGMTEEDPLKAFLFFFLALEVAILKGFKEINLKSELDAIVNYNPRIKVALRPFFEDRLVKTKSNSVKFTLREKFVWCANALWTEISDEDVVEFMAVKGIRDKISHGEISAPTQDDADRARKLTQRILYQHHPI